LGLGASSSFRIAHRSQPEDERLELVLAGELDMAAALRLEPIAERLLAQHGVRQLALDLADVAFIDSTGLSALLSIGERSATLGVEMTLVNISEPVRRLLDVSGMRALLRVD
jgi:anti-sigma B factor antagonist